MDIAILGYGTVGRGVDAIIASKQMGICVTKILELPDRLSDKRMTSDFSEILEDKSIQLVVECMGGLEPAHSYILDALRAKKHVVSSNKAVIAAYFDEFVKVAKENYVSFSIEASCGGGVPWISSIFKAKRIDAIDRISGIMNGTSNYIVDNMLKEGSDFADVLAKAQELGYAERDPSADIDGFDVLNKIKIAASIAFGSQLTNSFPVMGMRNVSKADLDYLAERGYTMKLLGRARADYESGRYALSVEPQAVSLDSLEAHVPQNFNLLSLHGKTVGDLKFYGQGAGELPTGNAIVQDVLDIYDGIYSEYDFAHELSYDPTLLRSDYILRSKVSILHLIEATTEGEGYWTLSNITSEKMAEVLDEIKKYDPKAIAFAISREDD